MLPNALTARSSSRFRSATRPAGAPQDESTTVGALQFLSDLTRARGWLDVARQRVAESARSQLCFGWEGHPVADTATLQTAITNALQALGNMCRDLNISPWKSPQYLDEWHHDYGPNTPPSINADVEYAPNVFADDSAFARALRTYEASRRRAPNWKIGVWVPLRLERDGNAVWFPMPRPSTDRGVVPEGGNACDVVQYHDEWNVEPITLLPRYTDLFNFIAQIVNRIDVRSDDGAHLERIQEDAIGESGDTAALVSPRGFPVTPDPPGWTRPVPDVTANPASVIDAIVPPMTCGAFNAASSALQRIAVRGALRSLGHRTVRAVNQDAILAAVVAHCRAAPPDPLEVIPPPAETPPATGSPNATLIAVRDRNGVPIPEGTLVGPPGSVHVVMFVVRNTGNTMWANPPGGPSVEFVRRTPPVAAGETGEFVAAAPFLATQRYAPTTGAQFQVRVRIPASGTVTQSWGMQSTPAGGAPVPFGPAMFLVLRAATSVTPVTADPNAPPWDSYFGGAAPTGGSSSPSFAGDFDAPLPLEVLFTNTGREAWNPATVGLVARLVELNANFPVPLPGPVDPGVTVRIPVPNGRFPTADHPTLTVRWQMARVTPGTSGEGFGDVGETTLRGHAPTSGGGTDTPPVTGLAGRVRGLAMIPNLEPTPAFACPVNAPCPLVLVAQNTGTVPWATGLVRAMVRLTGEGLEAREVEVPLTLPAPTGPVRATFPAAARSPETPGTYTLTTRLESRTSPTAAWTALGEPVATTITVRAPGTQDAPASEQGWSTGQKVAVVAVVGGIASKLAGLW